MTPSRGISIGGGVGTACAGEERTRSGGRWLHDYVFYPTTADFRHAWENGKINKTVRNAGMEETLDSPEEGPLRRVTACHVKLHVETLREEGLSVKDGLSWDIWGIDPLWHEDGRVISTPASFFLGAFHVLRFM
jgi:hypothetical protein